MFYRVEGRMVDEPLTASESNLPKPGESSAEFASVPPPSTASGAPHPLKVIGLYLLAVFVGAALAAPRFYASAEFLAEHFRGFQSLTKIPFHRYVGRALLLFSILGLPFLLKALKMQSFRAFGLRFERRHWSELLQGLAWGFAALAVAAALSIASGARTYDGTHAGFELTRHIRNALLAAIAVAVLEELLFRGALFGALRRRYSYGGAASISSALYAISHFFRQPSSPATVEWDSGFVILGKMLAGFTDVNSLVPGFFNLFIIGLILTLAVERTRSLLFAIGVHAGLVFWVKSFAFATRPEAGSNTVLWGSGKLADGWASGVVLVSILLILGTVLPRRAAKTNA